MTQHDAKPRKTWAMAIVALLLGAPALFLWLGRFKSALLYFVAEALATFLVLLSAVYGLFPMQPIADAGLELSVLLFAHLPVTLAAFLHARAINTAQPARLWYARWYIAFPAYPLMSLLLALAIRTFLYQPFNVPAASGFPNLVVGDYFFVSKFAYRFADPERGDVVTFKSPRDGTTDYVKRIIGLPGDRVQLQGGRLYLNAALVERTPEQVAPHLVSDRPLLFYRETLPGGRSHVIAEIDDNGIADNTVEFTLPDGHYFMMGDNRDNSADSRFADAIGFVPRQNIVGRFAWRYWNDAGVALSGRPEISR